VAHQPIELPDPNEPARVASAVRELALSYVVVTSVTRDDLPDGGAEHFAQTIRQIRSLSPEVNIEVLIPDFKGDHQSLRCVIEANPDVLNHNMETVIRLYPTVRPEADYHRSLRLLKQVKDINPDTPTKSGLMLGLGETHSEIEQTLHDLLVVECRMLTLGQYLQPSKRHLPVERFVHPDEFDQLKKLACDMGFTDVASGPFVRSSYHAKELFHASEDH
jgi:lipoic acid synthetase